MFAFCIVMCMDEKRRLDFMSPIGTASGSKHTIRRDNIFDDVICLYHADNFIQECPLFMAYEGETGIDDGGITRQDYLSGFIFVTECVP